MDKKFHHNDETRRSRRKGPIGDGLRGEEQPKREGQESNVSHSSRDTERVLARLGHDMVLLGASGEHVALQDATWPHS